MRHSPHLLIIAISHKEKAPYGSLVRMCVQLLPSFFPWIFQRCGGIDTDESPSEIMQPATVYINH
jgi:hypothetical protein